MHDLQTVLGYRFKAAALLTQALTHSSYTYENRGAPSNERLEFLGDAVLELCVSDWLYVRFPALPEGKLTRRRAALVCEPTLAAIARGLSLGAHLRMGNGEAASGGRNKPSILSDALEATLGAVYLDGGLEAARALVTRLFEPYSSEAPPARDHKTILQEILQKNTHETAMYQISAESGPPHARVYAARVTHQGRLLGEGTGSSKKEAEQQAAAAALELLNYREAAE